MIIRSEWISKEEHLAGDAITTQYYHYSISIQQLSYLFRIVMLLMFSLFVNMNNFTKLVKEKNVSDCLELCDNAALKEEERREEETQKRETK